MKAYTFLTILLISCSLSSYSKCITEKMINGDALNTISLNPKNNYFVLVNGTYKKLNKKTYLNSKILYKVQIHKPQGNKNDYIEYYSFNHIKNYIKEITPRFTKLNYQVNTIGQSLNGHNLYGIYPNKLRPDKKTIIILGRQHGDEGSANWIIEGLINQMLEESNKEWHEQFQVIIYPMINPDGAEKHTRYNSSGRDLNREWKINPKNTVDEVHTIYNHLFPQIKSLRNIVLSLDMHGSFYNDFIYRVSDQFISREFFSIQSLFIDELGRHDEWQNGNFNISNGDPQMARIRFIKDHNINTMTHETIRNIEIISNRSVETLKNQGKYIFQTINNLY
ncbi:MAG: hypothetical protein HOJ35_06365 [Bdellovibrionales bacterium]|jgi:hypothetical protein|nr:hypothetical protein [Bdellovibrionales bacterium]